MTQPYDHRAELRLPPPDRDWKQTLWVILAILMFGGMLLAAAIHTAPAVLSDWRIRETARPIDEGDVSEGKCHAKLVFHICDATLVVPTPAGAVARRVNYVFTGVHVGDYTVRVMADPAHPDLATTDLALAKLWNRTLTLVACVAVLLALIVMPALALIRNRRPKQLAEPTGPA
ncbi:hypothetical protein [Chitinasiproducens palmae]|uniref:Uncharacterized protein n=1 Tax=Chitinasiproducens palmae TaxID=1770053 RepID=A0A1H2PV73_9BURK|nr:hypothetical protein [Chitinasiproducens palmae]SDV51137.1 hypothetical protein SAMN05216551_11557 [Chitinasiproducens palmae]